MGKLFFLFSVFFAPGLPFFSGNIFKKEKNDYILKL
jgi:hypothetical protein